MNAPAVSLQLLPPWRRILLAIGPSHALSRQALAKIAALAKALDAEVEVFHCMFESRTARASRVGAVASDAEMRELAERQRQELESVARHLRAAGVRARTSVRWDYPVHKGIFRQVLRSRPDLLILYSKRHSRIARFLVPHPDSALLKSSPCPVLLIKHDHPYNEGCVLAAVDPTRSHSKPVALDAEIVAAAGLIARAGHAPLRIVHAGAPWPERLDPAAPPPSNPIYDEARAAYRERVTARLSELAGHGAVSSGHVHLIWGNPLEVLPQFTRNVGASVLVMGSIPRSCFGRFVRGHTAAHVLDRLACDVLVVRPPRSRRRARLVARCA